MAEHMPSGVIQKICQRFPCIGSLRFVAESRYPEGAPILRIPVLEGRGVGLGGVLLLCAITSAHADDGLEELGRLAAQSNTSVVLAVTSGAETSLPESIRNSPNIRIYRDEELRDSLQKAIETGDYERVQMKEMSPEMRGHFLSRRTRSSESELPKPTPYAKAGTVEEDPCTSGRGVASWWKGAGNPALPDSTAGISSYTYLIAQPNDRPWFNYSVTKIYGVRCNVETYLAHTNGGAPYFGYWDWTCHPNHPSGDCTNQAGVPQTNPDTCSAALTGTETAKYLLDVFDGTHTFKSFYVVVNEDYVSGSAPYKYRNRVWAFKPSTSKWSLLHERFHTLRVVDDRPYFRTNTIEYHYTHDGGPGCSNQKHSDLGFADFSICRTVNSTGGCTWYQPTQADSYIATDSGVPITIRHTNPNHMFHVTKP